MFTFGFKKQCCTVARKLRVDIATSPIKNRHISPPFFMSKIATFWEQIATFSLNLHIFWKKTLLFWKIWQLSKKKNSKISHQTIFIAFLWDNFPKNLEFCLEKVKFMFFLQKTQNLWDLFFKKNRHSKKTDRHLTLKIATVAINRHFWKHWF